ncbi:hypothetical protein SAMN05720354_1176 [Nitrosospira sp. Nsp1]|nr:hypothetical protein SAMN05720354_1176 [Nitrosospira sp. Nsp1]
MNLDLDTSHLVTRQQLHTTPVTPGLHSARRSVTSDRTTDAAPVHRSAAVTMICRSPHRQSHTEDATTGRATIQIGAYDPNKSVGYYSEFLRAFLHLNRMIPLLWETDLNI